MPDITTLYGKLFFKIWRIPDDPIWMDEFELYALIHKVELNMYICFGIIALLLIAIILILIFKKK